jgi:hypothetical protein
MIVIPSAKTNPPNLLKFIRPILLPLPLDRWAKRVFRRMTMSFCAL